MLCFAGMFAVKKYVNVQYNTLLSPGHLKCKRINLRIPTRHVYLGSILFYNKSETSINHNKSIIRVSNNM